MPLSLIVGPPNSGRAGLVLERLTAALARDPVLVVPTLEDASRFERELCEQPGGAGVLGASILTFGRLFDQVAHATGGSGRLPLSRPQRLHLARRAIAATELRALARSARRPGFAIELASLIEEIESSCLDPATVREQAAGAQGGFTRELADLYGAYVALRNELGLADTHVTAAEATAALRADPEAWGSRPVALYGFDDMTVEQLELVDALGRATEVWATVSFEDRAALRARASLREELRQRGGELVTETEPQRGNTASEILFQLERGFLVDGHPRAPLDPGLVLMEAAGERGQAEQIGTEIARLLAAGEMPDEIAIVLRDPDREGPLYEQVLAALGIPAAVEARVPFTRTAVGRGTVALLRASFGPRRAEDVLAFLRTPGRGRPGDVDWLERSLRRQGAADADAALRAWEEGGGREPFELGDLRQARDAAELLRTAARLVRNMAEYPHRRSAPHPVRERRLELRAAATAAAALEELAEVPGIEDGAGEALACLESLEVPLWRGPSDGHVRVTSPYRVRARRVRNLFVASLQEGEFPRRDRGEPLLSDEGRAELGLPPRAPSEDEERYLFYVCLSRPTHRLHLSWRSCDEQGAASPPSPLLEDVRDLIAPPPAGGAEDPVAGRVRRRTLADLTVEPADAASADELARALAARRQGAELPGGIEVAPPLADSVRGRLERAADRSGVQPGPLQVPAVLEALGDRRLFGASTLEAYALCSYRWFVDHELGPQGLDPDPDPLVHGSIVHATLERLYRDPPGSDRLPRPDDLEEWRSRARELVSELAAARGLDAGTARGAAARARIEALVVGFLEREAESQSELRPDPELLEARFGDGEEDARPPLELGDFSLHGMIDRVDLAPDGGAGLVRDYKASRQVTPGAKLAEEGKLQLQLYAQALAAHWGIRPLGGLYEPLAGTRDRRPRGILSRDDRDGHLAGLEVVDTDLLDADDFESAISGAAERAAAIVAGMRRGRITRDPIDDRCPRFCDFQSICRRERGAPPEPAAQEEDEEDG